MKATQLRKKSRKKNTAMAALLTLLSVYFGSPVLDAQAAETTTIKNEAATSHQNLLTKRIHKVFVQGNTYSPVQQIRAALPALREGKMLDVRKLSAEIQLANENGFRQLAVDLRPAEGDTLDAYIAVQEKAATKTVLGIDNTGNEYTGDWRTRLTYLDGNLGGRGQTAIISYVTSPDHFSDCQQFGFYYNIPLPKAKDNLYLTASYSDANSGTIIRESVYSIDASGKGNSVGLHYAHSLLRTPVAKEMLDFGLDIRQYKNDTNLIWSGTPYEIGVDVNSMPLSLTYQGSKRKGMSYRAYSLGYVHNLAGSGNNSTAQYEKYRTGTDASYQLWRASYNYQHMSPAKWLTNLTLSGQYTTERLIYPEQLGLGGAHSLRGLDERDVSGDRGVQASLEVYTPEFAKGQRLLAFVDAGYFSNVDPTGTETGSDSASAAGIGWRASFKNGYSLSADFGYVLNGTVNTPEHSTKLHVAATKVF